LAYTNIFGLREPQKDLVPIGIKIVNVGEIPAQGINVFLTFPEDCKSVPEYEALGGGLSVLATSISTRRPTSGGLFIDREGQKVARAWIDLLGNDLSMNRFRKIYVRFPEKEQEHTVKASITQHGFPPQEFEFSIFVKPSFEERVEYLTNEKAESE